MCQQRVFALIADSAMSTRDDHSVDLVVEAEFAKVFVNGSLLPELTALRGTSNWCASLRNTILLLLLLLRILLLLA